MVKQVAEENNVSEEVALYLISKTYNLKYDSEIKNANGEPQLILTFEPKSVDELLETIEDKTDLSIVFNNKVISSEGPHGGSGELSMAKVLGIINEEEVINQSNVDKYEEVGLHGFKQARENDPNIEEGAKDVEENGVYVDEEYGHRLFNLAINSVIFDVEKLLDF